MKNSYLIILILMLTGCVKKDDINISLNIGCEEECGEWERCSNVSNSWSYNWQCTPLLGLYTKHGHWSGELNINDLIGKVIGVNYPTRIYKKIKMRRVEL